ncbi:MAG: hypothetical protein WCF57_15360 [Pyrinomonadaceae bacterium]
MLSRKNSPSTIFLLFVVAIGLAYWVASSIIRPNLTLDQAILFRPCGDPDYLPQVAALAHLEFGETSVREKAGTGVRSFPFASVLLHATLLRLLGDAGFIVADILVFILYGCALSYFLRQAGVAPRIAEALTLLVLSGILADIFNKCGNFGTGKFPLTFWTTRFPRPFITELFVVLFLILMIRLLTDEERRRKASAWAILGVAGACLLQSDIHQAMTMMLVASCFLLYLLVKDSKAVLRGLLIACATATVMCAPFVYQRMHETPDVPRRWGMFTISGHQLIFIGGRRLLLLTLLTLAIELMLYYSIRRTISERTRAAFLITGAVLVASLLSGPLSLFALGRGIQVYHYPMRTELFIGYILLICAGWAAQDVARWLLKSLKVGDERAQRIKTVAFAAAAVACLSASAILARRNVRDERPTASIMSMSGVDESHYKTEFAELHGVLTRPEYRSAQTLGTFDYQLVNWWGYQGKYPYLPDLFNTTVTDGEIERRVFSYLRLLSVTPEDFNGLLDQHYFLARVLSSAKYHANSKFTPWPIEDYSPEAQARITIAPIVEGWRIELPLSERRRLAESYQHFDPLEQPVKGPDIFVLSKDEMRQFLRPERGNLRLVWSNNIFEVWVTEDRAARRR